MGKKWEVRPQIDAFKTEHVVPLDDLVEHIPEGCVCGPTVEPVPHPRDGSMGWLVTHHSLDGREADEVQA